MSRSFHLVVVPAHGPVTFTAVGEGTIRVGSSPEAEIHLADPDLAPVHARLEWRAAGHVLVREAMPLLVNGLRTKTQLLAPGDLVVLGKNTLAYRLGPPPRERAASSREARAAGVEAIRRMHAFAERVARREDPNVLAQQLLADLLAILGAARGTLLRLSADDDPVSAATCERGDFSGGEITFSRTLLARMKSEGRAVLVEDTRADPAAVHAESLAVAACSAIAAPIAIDGRLIGALYVSASAGAFGPAEVELLEHYASHAASLLERERRAAVLETRLVALGDLPGDDDETLLLGAAPAMQALRRTIRKIAPSRAPVLITGETGTGKELVARELHRLGPRARGPFVSVNCGAIPHELLAAELFGHLRGSFTHAHKDRRGHFRLADGGTLFLDEIGEMPPAQQVALLRVLQEGRITPVGAEQSEAVDVRVVCATHRDLKADVTQGRFRQDLYFRIAVVPLALPALRDRPEDIVRLAEHFLRREAREQGARDLRFRDDALYALRSARWEGNVRELEAAVRRAVLLRESDHIGPRELGLPPVATDADARPIVRPLAMARDEFLRGYVREIVDRFGGNRTAAADALLVTPRTVFRYLEE